MSTKDVLWNMLAEHVNSDVAILDLTNVTFLDSSALHCFLLLRKQMQQLGKPGIIRIANANAVIARILHICGLDALFELHDSVESAQDASI